MPATRTQQAWAKKCCIHSNSRFNTKIKCKSRSLVEDARVPLYGRLEDMWIDLNNSLKPTRKPSLTQIFNGAPAEQK
jgi:hypothetical protein